MTRPRLTADLTVMAANIESRKRSPELAARIREDAPDVVIVEQAYRARRFLRSIGGYRLRQYHRRPGAEWHGIAVLVKHGVQIRSRKPLRMRRWWTGPKAGRRHAPRVYPVLTLRKGGVTWRVIGIHLPTRNQPGPQAESLDAIAAYFRRHPDAPIIAAGDWNRKAHELEQVAARADAQIVTGRTKVDHALVRNVEQPTRERLSMQQGAHGWALYTVTATRETS